jgi:hypothetical protein
MLSFACAAPAYTMNKNPLYLVQVHSYCLPLAIRYWPLIYTTTRYLNHEPEQTTLLED